MKKIHVSVLGTKIASDSIEFRKRDFTCDARVVEKSPFSFTCDDEVEKLCQNMPPLEISMVNDYKTKIFLLDFHKKVYPYVKQFNSDIIVLDILCMRTFIYEMEFDNGKIYRITWDSDVQIYLPIIREYMEKIFSSKIVREARINPMLWPKDKLEYEISLYCDKLKKEFGSKKIVLLESQNIYQYFDKFARFSVLPQVEMVNQYNDFYDLCVDYFKKYFSCFSIKKTSNLYGDEKIKFANIFHYNLNYYSYINECLYEIAENRYTVEKSNTILARHNNKNEIELKQLMLKSIVDLTYLRNKGRKVIVIGEIYVYSYMLKQKYGMEIYKGIPYDETTDIEVIQEQISPYAWKNDEYMIVVTHLGGKKGILRKLWENGYGCNIGYYCINHPLIELKEFCGHYEDFYGNKLDIKTPITIRLAGCGISVVVGNGKVSKGSFVHLLNESSLMIENGLKTGEQRFTAICYDGSIACFGGNVYLGNNFHLRNSFFNSMKMGENCVVEDDAILFNGDGHAIFDLNKNENVNYNLMNTRPEKHKIIIGDEVRIGRHAFVLSGSNIPSGCLIEAESFVNKVFKKEKSYIAGFPAVAVEV